MPSEGYLLGIDIGTGGLKTTIIDTGGNFVSDGYAEFITTHPRPNWAEQNPSDWVDALRVALNACLLSGEVRADAILGLAIDSASHNVVLLDRKDEVLCPTILWTDQRSVDESEELLLRHRQPIFSASYNTPSPTWSLPQLMWIRNNQPEIFRRVHRITFANGYLGYLLTGSWYAGFIDAQGSMLFDNNRWSWSEDICAIGGIPRRILPPVVHPVDVVGRVTRQAAEWTGLREGTPVTAGGPDTALEHYCVGALEEGDCVVKIATSGTVNIFNRHPRPDPNFFTYSHVIDGVWFNSTGTNSAAHSLRWYRDTHFSHELSLEKAGGRDAYSIMDAEALQIPPGANGLVYSPYLSGERSPYWDSKLRGSFIGMTALHTRGHFNRAVMEGVAFSIKDNLRLMEEVVDIGSIKLVGGGAKSPFWRGVIADVLNRPIVKMERVDSSFGSAMLAGVSCGVFASHEEAIRQCVRVSNVTTPNPEHVELYEKQFSIYKLAHDKLAEIYHQYY